MEKITSTKNPTVHSMRGLNLRKPIINLYSAVGAGIAARFAYDDGVVTPMYDLTFFGLTLGRKVYFFAEVGAGISGSLRAGVGYRF